MLETNLSNQNHHIRKIITVREILLLNKKTGLPILSRVYKKTIQIDPILISGLLTAIIYFAESLGGSYEINDIGIKDDIRIFIRIQEQLACIVIMEGVDFNRIDAPKFMDIVDDITSRIFEVILMIFTSPFTEPLTPLEIMLEVSYEDSIKKILSNLSEEILSSHKGLGEIIDNIVMESTMLFENEDLLGDVRIESIVESMEKLDSTYLNPSFKGVSKNIKIENKEKIKEIISKMMTGSDER